LKAELKKTQFAPQARNFWTLGHTRERFSNRKIVFTDYVSKNFGACGAAYRAFFEYNVMYTIVRNRVFFWGGVSGFKEKHLHHPCKNDITALQRRPRSEKYKLP
jgi:hypothetical protein